MRIASIDIGTNTILMLIADIGNLNNITYIHEEFAIAKLGENTDKTGLINDDAITRASVILSSYIDVCKSYNVEYVIAVATSAMRDAKNGDYVKKILESILAYPILTIDGNTEALLSYIGTVEGDENSVLIDIGGGSTEIVLGKSDNILWKKSLDIGAVRLSEKYFRSIHPPSNFDVIIVKRFLNDLFGELPVNIPAFDKVYAVAGTATTIATTLNQMPDKEVSRIDGYELSYNSLKYVNKLYYSHTVEDIITKFKVSSGRADLIYAGSLILLALFETLNIEKCIVSAKGLRYGIIKGHILGFI